MQFYLNDIDNVGKNTYKAGQISIALTRKRSLEETNSYKSQCKMCPWPKWQSNYFVTAINDIDD